MSDENQHDVAPTAADQTWVDTVQTFEASATWLTGADRPQLKALYAIAAALDAGTFQAALISQFTLVHRGLLKASRPGEGDGAPDPDEMPDILDLWGRRS